MAVDKHNQQYRYDRVFSKKHRICHVSFQTLLPFPRHLLRKAKAELAKKTRLDYYTILGLEKTCGESDVKKAYYKKSKEYHPDRSDNRATTVYFY